MDTKQLDERIKQSGYKRTYIAEQIGISYQSLCNKLHGRTDFTVKQSAALKKLLGMSETEYISIFFGSDVPHKEQGG